MKYLSRWRGKKTNPNKPNSNPKTNIRTQNKPNQTRNYQQGTKARELESARENNDRKFIP
jgi:hypothetical protein